MGPLAQQGERCGVFFDGGAGCGARKGQSPLLEHLGQSFDGRRALGSAENGKLGPDGGGAGPEVGSGFGQDVEEIAEGAFVPGAVGGHVLEKLVGQGVQMGLGGGGRKAGARERIQKDFEVGQRVWQGWLKGEEELFEEVGQAVVQIEAGLVPDKAHGVCDPVCVLARGAGVLFLEVHGFAPEELCGEVEFVALLAPGENRGRQAVAFGADVPDAVGERAFDKVRQVDLVLARVACFVDQKACAFEFVEGAQSAGSVLGEHGVGAGGVVDQIG